MQMRPEPKPCLLPHILILIPIVLLMLKQHLIQQLIMNAITNCQQGLPIINPHAKHSQTFENDQHSPASQVPVVLAQHQQSKQAFKWSFEEHAKYICFLEMNRLKIKSKLIRKSNAFFKEMEKFLETKTALQCRSHHQKFQERYKFPHRIITGEKKYIPIDIYNSVTSQARLTDAINNGQKDESKEGQEMPKVRNAEQIQKEYATVCCQTEISDVSRTLHYGERNQQPVSFNYPFQMVEPYMFYQQFQYHY